VTCQTIGSRGLLHCMSQFLAQSRRAEGQPKCPLLGVMQTSPSPWAGAGLCLVAVFLPSFLLVIGTLPFWDQLRRLPVAQGVMRGVNAAVVGLLLAALYNPVWTSGITSGIDFALAAAGFLLLFMWQVPPWLVVALSAVGAGLIAAF
jgi:chromate transporter